MTGQSLRSELRPPSVRGWVWWLPLAAVVVDVAAELIVRGREPVSFMLIAVPPLAAATRGPRGTALSAVVCLGLQMWMAARRPGHFDEQHHVAVYIATTLIGIASIALARQRERTRQHLIRANSVAEAMQRILLRPVPRRLGPVRAAGFYEAGEGGTLVGGDLYDVCETPFGVRAIIGDVRGKGLDAVQTVAAVLGSFRVSAHEWQSLSALAERLELSIARNSPAGDDGDPELFVTALVLEFPPGGGEVRIVDRGHPAPLVVGLQGARRLVTAPGLPLGLGGLAPDGDDTTVHLLGPSDVLVLHTDGVSEARNADGVFYPVLERLGERFCGERALDPEAVVSFVRTDAERWSAQSDDDDRAVLALTLGAVAPP
ncbi:MULTISPECIES: PP2C family protein-serine/threonine phosphatase [unclassified Streptomyces]|uniref:PP2C family protein-serine/threonine phosphatase n=1 Tax=unclassified Streptomyces TaxID=2593676 RepID=UPI002365AA63|nr:MULTISPECIES: PP2C family protein-serine/threonine phosphatase [unclassified Streptomyces]MDF3147969.1 PP2C family protein-serine/threonine phosphatase [Streptomyces sp. T21Q-yed]WDF43740.1 PP2C family protein-serine/threonine phosphatase [Streptomyces sp. T12]